MTCASWFLVIIQITLLIISKMQKNIIFRQDIHSGQWYVGFYAFIEYYNLYSIIYGTTALLGALIIVRCCMVLYQHKYEKRLKAVKSISCMLKLVLVGVYYLFIKRRQFITWSTGLFITSVIYFGTIIVLDLFYAKNCGDRR